MTRDYVKRPTIKTLLHDPWIKSKLESKIIEQETGIDVSCNLAAFKKKLSSVIWSFGFYWEFFDGLRRSSAVVKHFFING